MRGVKQGAQIVFLNGPSSSGKTSIARQLLLVLGRPYFHLSIDAFHAMRAAEPTEPLDERTVLGFHRAVAGMAAAGNDIVVDHALEDPHWFADCVEQWRDHDVVFVGVRCALAELNRRERLRDDRETGLAARQFHRVHAHGGYDLECDTEASHPRDCAMQIKDYLVENGRDRVFANRRKRLTLLPLGVEHAEELAAVLNDPALHTYIGGRPETADELRVRYARWAAGSPDPAVRWHNWAIRLTEADRLVGTVQATITGDTAEVAWVVGTGWQGRGIATEAARELLDWLTSEGVRRVVAHVHPDNAASARVAAALGFSSTERERDGEVEWELTLGSD